MSDYKDFTLNDPDDAGPWGIQERQNFRDIIDTLVQGCLVVGKDTVNGHRHLDLYDLYGDKMVDANNVSSLLTLGKDDSNCEVRVLMGNGSTSGFTVRRYGSTLNWIYCNPNNNNVSINAEGGADQATIIGNHSANIGLYIDDSDTHALRIADSSGDIITLDTVNNDIELQSPGASLPVFIDSNSDIFTRKWVNITSYCTFDGWSSMDSDNRVYMKQAGGLVLLRLRVKGTSDQQYAQITFPFKASVTDGDTSEYVGLARGYHTAAGIMLSVFRPADVFYLQFNDIDGNLNHWPSSGNKSIDGTLVLEVVDPEFTLT